MRYNIPPDHHGPLPSEAQAKPEYPPGQDPIVESVRTKLLERSQTGIKKYGTMLNRTDLSRLDWLRHAQEEALDLANYLEVLIQREENPPVTIEHDLKIYGKTRLPYMLEEVYEIRSPVECERSLDALKEALGNVKLAGKRCIITGLESFATLRPIRIGEALGVTVEWKD